MEETESLPRHKRTTAYLMGKMFGVSAETLRQGRKVNQAAKEDPERFGDLVEQMATGERSMWSIYQEMRRRKGITDNWSVDAAMNRITKAIDKELARGTPSQCLALLVSLEGTIHEVASRFEGEVN